MLGTEEILAYVVLFEAPHVTIFADDYYFKPEGIAPGAVKTVDHIKVSEKVRVLWIQFVDGTEWGNPNVGRTEVLLRRQPLLRLVSGMVNAYSHGGEKEFLAYLESNKAMDSFVQQVWRMQEQTGTEGAVSHLKIRLASAAKHDKMLVGQ